MTHTEMKLLALKLFCHSHDLPMWRNAVTPQGIIVLGRTAKLHDIADDCEDHKVLVKELMLLQKWFAKKPTP